MNTYHTTPRSDCTIFAKCGTKSLSYCRRHHTEETCSRCTLIRRKPKSQVSSNSGIKLKQCTICGRWLPIFRFYARQVVRGDKTYQSTTSECRMCKSTKVINQRKSIKDMNKKKNDIRVHVNPEYFGNRLYVFTKDSKHCIAVEYNPAHDFGKGSPSGARIGSVEIHTNNGFLFGEKYKEISLSELPECILELLTYLK